MEVLIAVAILGLALTAIFSSQAGAIKAAHRARKASTATLLARCKMGEVEEKIMEEGFPAIDDMGTDGCCEDAEIDGFRCEWEVKRIVLPDEIFADPAEEGEGDDGLLGGLLGSDSASTGDGDDGTQPPDAPTPGNDPLSALGSDGLGSVAGSNPTADLLAGGSGGGLAELAIQMTYPVLKPLFEEQIRRATVRVVWEEGTQEKSFDVVRFLVADQATARAQLEEGEAQENGSGQTQTGSNRQGGTN